MEQTKPRRSSILLSVTYSDFTPVFGEIATSSDFSIPDSGRPRRTKPSKPSGPKTFFINNIRSNQQEQTSESYQPYYQLLRAILGRFFEKFGWMAFLSPARNWGAVPMEGGQLTVKSRSSREHRSINRRAVLIGNPAFDLTEGEQRAAVAALQGNAQSEFLQPQSRRRCL